MDYSIFGFNTESRKHTRCLELSQSHVFLLFDQTSWTRATYDRTEPKLQFLASLMSSITTFRNRGYLRFLPNCIANGGGRSFFTSLAIPRRAIPAASFLTAAAAKDNLKRQKTKGRRTTRVRIPLLILSPRGHARMIQNINIARVPLPPSPSLPHNSRVAERVTHARRRLYPKGPHGVLG